MERSLIAEGNRQEEMSSPSTSSSTFSVRRTRTRATLLSVAAVVGAVTLGGFGFSPAAMITEIKPKPPSTGPDTSMPPKEARNFRTVETKRSRDLPERLLPKWFARHPCPERPVRLNPSIPGNVQSATKREMQLRTTLRRGEVPNAEEFNKVIQIFARRALQDVKWLPAQRREFVRRAKSWATEMLLQNLKPSKVTVQTLMRGYAMTGNVAGAEFWFDWLDKQSAEDHRYNISRFELNSVIWAYGVEGRPHEARQWLQNFEKEGLLPDPRSYAGVMEGWNTVGNRRAMLETLLEMQQLEADNKLAKPDDPLDSALPYYALARSYMTVGDAARSISILKLLKVKQIPLGLQAHLIRLRALLKVPEGPTRSIAEIERALMDSIASRHEGEPLFVSKVSDGCRRALGDVRYKEILKSFNVTHKSLVSELPKAEAIDRWREALIQRAKRPRHAAHTLRPCSC